MQIRAENTTIIKYSTTAAEQSLRSLNNLQNLKVFVSVTLHPEPLFCQRLVKSSTLLAQLQAYTSHESQPVLMRPDKIARGLSRLTCKLYYIY